MSFDLSTVQHHPVLEQIVDVLCTKTDNSERGFFRVEVAYFLGKMASTMRATVVTKDRGEIPVNIYALALAHSGYGKGYSITIVENEIMKGFKERFMEDTFPVLSEQNLWIIAHKRAGRKGSDPAEEFNKAQAEFNQQGEYPFTFDSGSTPAVKQLRHKLLLADVGAINLQIDEIGSNLLGNTEVLTTFLELYDQGMVKLKLTKNTADNQRNQVLDGKTPTNMLLFGTPSKLLDGSQTEEQFNSLLETGYARRCFFAFGRQERVSKAMTPQEVYDRLTNPTNDATIKQMTGMFYALADPANFNWKMEVPDDVAIELLRYRIDCEKQAEGMAEHEEVRKAELAHRYFKALKLAGAYAFVDGSITVEMHHLMSAIKLTEESGEAFQTILNREKSYVKLAKFIAQSTNEVTHADLHEALPFYKSSQAARNELMTLATAWGYKKHIIIKKSMVDGIEFFKGETLTETDLNKIVISYSDHWAYHYRADEAPFDQLHVVTQQNGYNWSNHHFRNGHRSDENVIAGFNMIAIDVDGTISLAAVHELMKEYKFLTYTTKRHTPEENRFRLILPINYHLELDQEEYREFMNTIMAWLPFKTDEAANQRSKKWSTFSGGSFHYNLEAPVLDVLDFIPKTSRNEQHLAKSKQLDSLDNLERWFAQRVVPGARNSQMIKYALCLVDAGWALVDVRRQVHAFNKKLADPMSENEIDTTIMVTVAKRYQKP